LVRERIEFFINVSPVVAILDVPYLVVVWDLQHRRHPFFPEVSSRGEWQRREDFFSQVLRRAVYVVTGTGINKKEVQMFYGVPKDGSAFFRTRRQGSRWKTPRKTRRCWPNSDCRPITFFIPRSFGATRITWASCAQSCISKKKRICTYPLFLRVPIKGTK